MDEQPRPSSLRACHLIMPPETPQRNLNMKRKPISLLSGRRWPRRSSSRPPPVATKACGCSTIRPRNCSRRSTASTPTDEWLEHLQQSSVRFNSGGSGSFVSSDGLVMTNHHVGADALQKLSTKDKDYLRRRLPRQDPGRGDQVPRPGAERADEHRGRDRAGQRRGEARHDARPRPRRPAAR